MEEAAWRSMSLSMSLVRQEALLQLHQILTASSSPVPAGSGSQPALPEGFPFVSCLTLSLLHWSPCLLPSSTP